MTNTTNPNASPATTRTYAINGRARIEGTQRGYIVKLHVRDGRRPIDIAIIRDDGTTRGISAAYTAAAATASSIDAGRFVGMRDGWLFRVDGRTLRAERAA